eukprot:UN00387
MMIYYPFISSTLYDPKTLYQSVPKELQILLHFIRALRSKNPVPKYTKKNSKFSKSPVPRIFHSLKIL